MAAPSLSPYLLTTSGIQFTFLNPRPDQIDIEDIITAMSRIYRFGGHGQYGVPLLLHCGLGAEILRDHGYGAEAVKCFMLHDAHEAYTGDWPTPLKDQFPEIRNIQDKIDMAISTRFSVPLWRHKDTTKFMDEQMFAMESRLNYDAPLPSSHKALRIQIVGSFHDTFLERVNDWKENPVTLFRELWEKLP